VIIVRLVHRTCGGRGGGHRIININGQTATGLIRAATVVVGLDCDGADAAFVVGVIVIFFISITSIIIIGR
jgi:hypothetical protein